MRSMVLLLYPLINMVLAAMPEKPQMAKWAAARSGGRAKRLGGGDLFRPLERLGEQGRHQAQAEGEKQPRQRPAQMLPEVERGQVQSAALLLLGSKMVAMDTGQCRTTRAAL